MATDHQKNRLALLTIAVVSCLCIVAGASFLTGLLSGDHQVFAVLLILAGIVGLVGVLDLRRSLFRV